MAGLLHREKCNDALLTAIAVNDPKKLLEMRNELENEPLEISEDWEPPSLDRIKKNMLRASSR